VRKYQKQEVPRYAKELIDFMKSKYDGLLGEIRNNPKTKIDPVRGKLDCAGVGNRKQGRSKYGARRAKK
jgi:hypothetical protein